MFGNTGMTQIPLGSSRLDSSRLNSRVRRVERVELVVSSESSCAVRLARHSQNAWDRHVERVESCRVESSQVEFGLISVLKELNTGIPVLIPVLG